MAQARTGYEWSEPWIDQERRWRRRERVPDPRPALRHCHSIACCDGPLRSKVPHFDLRGWGRKKLVQELLEAGALDDREDAIEREAAADRAWERQENRRLEREGAAKARRSRQA